MLKKTDYKSILEIPIKLLGKDKDTQISEVIDKNVKLLLCVNVATKWGLTDENYK